MRCVLPWYNSTGWLGIKHQLTYLLSLQILFSSFSAVYFLCLWYCEMLITIFFRNEKILYFLNFKSGINLTRTVASDKKNVEKWY